MGSFFEEILKGGMGDILGSVLGGSSSKKKGSKSGGGLGDIVKDLRKQMEGDSDASDVTVSTTGSKSSGSKSSSSKSSGSLSDIAKEIRRQAGMSEREVNAPSKNTTNIDLDVEEETSKSGKKKTTGKTAQKESSGGLGSIFGNGIDLGNLGSIAESVIKTIGLGGRSI